MSAPAARYSRAADGRVETLDGPRVGPGHDHEIGIAAGGDGRADLGRHRRGIDQPLAGEVAASLGQDLVFQVQAGDSGFLVKPDGPLDVDGFAEARIGVAQDWQCRRPGQHRRLFGEFGLGQQADIRQAGPAGRAAPPER